MKPRIFLRGDGSSNIGLGHVHRLLTIGSFLQDCFELIFIIKNPDKAICDTIKKAYTVETITEEITLEDTQIEILKDDILVTDGYQFDTEFQKSVKAKYGCKTVCIDDLHRFRFVSDLVFNHANADSSVYDLSTGTKLLFGPAYALVKNEFYEGRKTLADRNGIFVCFGGADPDNHTLKTVERLQSIKRSDKRIEIVIGSAYLHTDELDKIAAAHTNIHIHRNLDVQALIRLMIRCDTAICSASTIAYEYCSVGGLLFLKKTADNQNDLYQTLLTEKAAYDFSGFFEVGKDFDRIRTEMYARQKQIFDGNAGKRIAREIKRLYLNNNFIIRKAVKEDIDTYFEWANDPTVRSNSFNQNPISYEEHCAWFNAACQAENLLLLICTTRQNIPVASIRFRIENDKAVLSYLVDQKFRGIGIGSDILNEGASFLFRERKEISIIEGFVKASNIASVKSFQASGFFEAHLNEAITKRFVLNRNDYEGNVQN